MMRRFQIIEAKLFHCGQMARLLRAEHGEAIACLGISAHHELQNRFYDSSFRRAWLIDGKLAGLGGVAGPVASAYGYIWLALSRTALRYPIEIVKEARRQLDEIMIVKRELATTIIGGDEAAKRFAVFLGFHVADTGPGAPAHSRFSRRDLTKFLDTNPDVRIPVGSGYAIALGYHHDREAA